jgi:hypothetical protein
MKLRERDFATDFYIFKFLLGQLQASIQVCLQTVKQECDGGAHVDGTKKTKSSRKHTKRERRVGGKGVFEQKCERVVTTYWLWIFWSVHQ